MISSNLYWGRCLSLVAPRQWLQHLGNAWHLLGAVALLYVLGVAYSQQACSRENQASSPANTEQWKQALTSGTLDQRRQKAIDTRTCDTQLKQNLIPVFIELLRHERDGQIRLAIFDTVTDMGPAAAATAPALVHAMRQDFGGRNNEELHQDYRAALALASIGSPAVECLRNVLTEGKENLRAEAAMALGRIGPAASTAIPDLIALLKDDSQRVRSDAIKALGSMGASAAQPLIDAAQDEKEVASAAALSALAGLGLQSAQHEKLHALIEQALGDKRAEVRAAAVGMLPALNLPPKQLQTHLLDLLVDSSAGVRNSLINVCVKNPTLLSGLEPELAERMLDPQEEIAWQAAYLLQVLGNETSELMLQMARDERSRMEHIARVLASHGSKMTVRLQAALEDANDRIRGCAALALGQLRPVTDDAVSKLSVGLLREDQNRQATFIKAIALLEYRARAALPAVKQLTLHPEPEVRRQVIEILFAAAPHDKALVEQLMTMLGDADLGVKRAAIVALNSLGPIAGPSIPQVIEQLEIPDMGVRVAASELIASHGLAAASAVPQLMKLLDQGPPESIVVFINTLGQLGDAAKPAVPKMLVHLRHENPKVRTATLKALSDLRLEPEELKPHLFVALRDAESSVRNQASSVMRRLGEKISSWVPELIALVGDDRAGEQVKRLLERMERYKTDPADRKSVV